MLLGQRQRCQGESISDDIYFIGNFCPVEIGVRGSTSLTIKTSLPVTFGRADLGFICCPGCSRNQPLKKRKQSAARWLVGLLTFFLVINIVTILGRSRHLAPWALVGDLSGALLVRRRSTLHLFI